MLHVIPSVSRSSGGPSKALGQMERVLTEAGLEIVSITTDDDGPNGRLDVRPCTPVESNGATRFYFPLQVRPYKASLPLLRWLRSEVPKFDLVHVHALFSFAPVAAAWIARSAGVPYIIRPLGVLNHYGMEHRRSRLKALSIRVMEGGLLRDAAAVHFTAAQEQEEAESLGIQMRSRVVPLGIEPMPAVSADLFLEAYPGLGKRRLLFLSRVDPKKNIEVLLAAVALCRRKDPEISLILCGDGDTAYVSQLKAMAAGLGLEDCVVWAGHVEGRMKASAFAAAHLFVLPSFSENFGIAAVEALSVGLPCILGEGVAVAKRVDEAGAGRAVAPTTAAFSDAIASTLRAPDLLKDMSARARQLAQTEYSLRAMRRALLAMYADACSGDGTTRS
ncbi:MAG: glycosyltransferase [Lysobacter sp.]|nr:glycosyltransferase [Lysobacter sp.]